MWPKRVLIAFDMPEPERKQDGQTHRIQSRNVSQMRGRYRSHDRRNRRMQELWNQAAIHKEAVRGESRGETGSEESESEG